jgi:NB-ARC domain
MTDLSKLVAENLQADPDASVETLVARLKGDNRIIQVNTGNALAFQTLVEEGGTANVGVHLHGFDQDKLDEVLKAFWKSLQPVEIPNNVPRSGVAKFIGREPELERLHRQLQQGNLVSISAVEGMGGVGKTELAIQYTQQYASAYEGGICWLFAREFNVGTQIIGFAQSRLNLTIPEGLELPDQVAYCWRNWRAGEVLLVLDDVVNYPRDVEPYLPPASFTRFKLVITTRKKFGPPIQSLPLDVLSPEQSLELLTALIGEERIQQELDIAKTLCNWLEHLPLGIELVGRYLLARTELSLSTLWGRLQDKAQQRQAIKAAALKPDKEINTSTGKRGAEAAFELSWDELDSNSQHLGKLLSLFAAAPIPWHLAEAVERKYCEDLDAGKEFELEEIEEARAKLIKLHLLQLSQQQEQIYRLHSLIREFFRSKLEGEADENSNATAS